MTARDGKRRPLVTDGALNPDEKFNPSVSPETDIERTRNVVSRFHDAYAVVVIGKAARRHVFFGLPSAQRAVDRARARGDFADLVLVKLTPVGEV